MPDIPQFNAQIQQVQVPSLRNYQEEQNEQVYKAMADVSKRATDVAESLYAAEQIDLAQRKGGEFTKDDSIENLPMANTRAQKAYNDAAIAAYTVDTNTELIKAIDKIAYANRNNPQKFKSLAYAELDGRTKNAGIYAKKIQEPFVRKIESDYYSILSSVTEQNKQNQKEYADYQIYNRIRGLGDKVGASRDIESALILSDIEKLVKTNQMSSARAIQLTQYVADASMGEQVAQYLSTSDPTQRQQRYADILNGNTGVLSIDSLSTFERVNSASKYFEKINQQADFESKAGQKAFNQFMSAQTQAIVNEHPEIRAANPTISYSKGGYDNDLAKALLSGVETPSEAKAKLDADYYTHKRITLDQYIASLKSLDESYKANVANPYVNQRINIVLEQFPDKRENDVVVGENLRKKYIINEINKKLHQRQYSNDEVDEVFNKIVDNSKKIYDDSNMYKYKYSPETFRRSFPNVNYEQASQKYNSDSIKPPHTWGGLGRIINIDITTPDGLKNRTNIMVDYFESLDYNNSQAQMMADHFLKIKKGELNGNTNAGSK